MNGYRETAWRAEDVRPTIFQHFNDFAAKPVWLRLGDNLYGRVNPFFSDRGLDRRYLRSAPLRRFHQWLSSRMACAERARFPTLPLERVRQHPEGAAWSAGLLLPELALSAHLLPYPGLPGVIAALMELSRIVGDGPDYYIPLIASSFAALAAAPTFGVEPWHFYLLGELGVWGGGAATLVLLAGLGARRMPLPLAAAVTIIAVHSAIAQQRVPLHLPGDHAGHGYGRHRTGASGSLGTRLVAGSARAPKDGYRRLGRPRPELVVPGLVPCVDGGRSDGPRLSTGQRGRL